MHEYNQQLQKNSQQNFLKFTDEVSEVCHFMAILVLIASYVRMKTTA